MNNNSNSNKINIIIKLYSCWCSTIKAISIQIQLKNFEIRLDQCAMRKFFMYKKRMKIMTKMKGPTKGPHFRISTGLHKTFDKNFWFRENLLDTIRRFIPTKTMRIKWEKDIMSRAGCSTQQWTTAQNLIMQCGWLPLEDEFRGHWA